MTTFFKEGNNEGTRELFTKRSLYNGYMEDYASRYRNLVNFNLGEKFLYGRISRSHTPIVVKQGFTSNHLKSISTGTKQASDGGSLRARNFVVDAFNDLAMQFKKCALSGLIDPNDKYLSTLTAYKAYEDPHIMYAEYSTGYRNAFIGMFRKAQLGIITLEAFLDQLYTALAQSAPITPFTLAGFIKSRRCPINVTGLAIEIADVDAANDAEKWKLFVESNNWEFYLNAARTYGFMVDQMAPWRLVADIGSSAMVAYAKRYQLPSTDSILSNLPYGDAHFEGFATMNFRDNVLAIYEGCVPLDQVRPRECNAQIAPEWVKRETLTQVRSSVRTASFMIIYMHIRLLEEEVKIDSAAAQQLMNDTMSLYKSSMLDALLAFELIVNKPFDCRGSLTYNNMKHYPAWQEYLEKSEGESEIFISTTGDDGTMGNTGGGGY